MLWVELGISVALIELALGIVLGNPFSLDPNAIMARVRRELSSAAPADISERGAWGGTAPGWRGTQTARP